MTDTPDDAPAAKGGRPPRFLLALPEDVRAALDRAAFVNGRTLTAEINLRLRASLEEPVAQSPKGVGGGISMYSKSNTATVLHIDESGRPVPISGTDAAMLDVFRALPPEKQLALLSLFK